MTGWLAEEASGLVGKATPIKGSNKKSATASTPPVRKSGHQNLQHAGADGEVSECAAKLRLHSTSGGTNPGNVLQRLHPEVRGAHPGLDAGERMLDGGRRTIIASGL
jgi:hypothetical protein